MTGLDVLPTVVITHTTSAMLKQIKVKDQQIILSSSRSYSRSHSRSRLRSRSGHGLVMVMVRSGQVRL